MTKTKWPAPHNSKCLTNVTINFRYEGSNMRYDFNTNVTVVTLNINKTDYPCRYINDRGQFDFQTRDLKLVRILWSFHQNLQWFFRVKLFGTKQTTRTHCPLICTVSHMSIVKWLLRIKLWWRLWHIRSSTWP